SVTSDRPVWETPTTTLPQLSIADVQISEGNSGSKLATFTINLSAISATPVTFNVATSNGSATTASGDYVALPLTPQSIPAGQTSKTFTVTLDGDTALEANETFTIYHRTPVRSRVIDNRPIWTILTDARPQLSIADVQMSEGNSGSKPTTFTVKLSKVAA